jgi:hypothetical protein
MDGFSSFINIDSVARAVAGLAARVEDAAEETRTEIESALERRERERGDLGARAEAREADLGGGALRVEDRALVALGEGGAHNRRGDDWYYITHLCAGRRDIGCVLCWDGRMFALVWREKDGSFTESAPSVWRIPHGEGLVGMSLGTSHGAVATEEGVYVWGELPGAGEMGTPSNPRRFGMGGIKHVASAPATLFIHTIMNVYAMGSNVGGICGVLSDAETVDSFTPMAIGAGRLTGSTTIDACDTHVAIKPNNDVYVAGSVVESNFVENIKHTAEKRYLYLPVACGSGFTCIREEPKREEMGVPRLVGRFLGRDWVEGDVPFEELGVGEYLATADPDWTITYTNMSAGPGGIVVYDRYRILHISPQYDGNLRLYKPLPLDETARISEVIVRENDLILSTSDRILVLPTAGGGDGVAAGELYPLPQLTLNAPRVEIGEPLVVNAPVTVKRSIKVDDVCILTAIRELQDSVSVLQESVTALEDSA